MEESLRVVDAVLKVETPAGPCWRRYNNDGFGQRPDGSPFTDWGQGRAWPLLTGERGHYELAAGRDVRPYVEAMEGFASRGGMLPEQVWDASDIPGQGLFLGCPTGSAMPLMWAHAEYIKLLRSVRDGVVFDRVAAVADRYLPGKGRRDLEIWKFNRQARSVAAGSTLRIQGRAPFRLRWSLDAWISSSESRSLTTALGIHYADVVVPRGQQADVQFTFFWTEAGSWEGKDFRVRVDDRGR
jgi:glucoamylase